MTTNKDDNNSINNNDNDNDNHVCAVRLMMSWVHAGHVLPVIFIIIFSFSTLQSGVWSQL